MVWKGDFMQHGLKKRMGLAFAAAMVVSLLSGVPFEGSVETVRAAEPTLRVLGGNQAEASGAGYTYKSESYTLTLNGYNGGYILFNGTNAETFHVVLEGENSISSNCSLSSYALGASDANMEISGDGSLTVTNTNTASHTCAIHATGDLTINGGSIKVNNDSEGTAVCADKNIVITDGNVEIASENGWGIGSLSERSITISGGTVTVKAKRIGLTGPGTISGGNVTVNVTNPEETEGAVQGDLSVSGSSTVVDLTSPGRALSGSVDISGGKVTITSTEGSGVQSLYGALDQEVIKISDGELTVKGKEYGVNYGTAVINGGKVVFIGTEDAVNEVKIKNSMKGAGYTDEDGTKEEKLLEVNTDPGHYWSEEGSGYKHLKFPFEEPQPQPEPTPSEGDGSKDNSGNNDSKSQGNNSGDIAFEANSNVSDVLGARISDATRSVMDKFAQKKGQDARLEVLPRMEADVIRDEGQDAVNRVTAKISEAFPGVGKEYVRHDYLDMSVFTSVDRFASKNKVDNADVGAVLEIIVSYDLSGKYDAKIIRDHAGVSNVLKELSGPVSGDLSGAEGSYYVDKENNRIYVYAQYFSTYSIAYSTVQRQNTVGGGSSSGSSGPKWVGLLPSGAGILSPNDAPVMQGAGGTVAQGAVGTADPSATVQDPAASAAGAQGSGKSAPVSNGKQTVSSPKMGDENAVFTIGILALLAATLLSAKHLHRAAKQEP